MHQPLSKVLLLLLVLSTFSYCFGQAYTATRMKVPHTAMQGVSSLWVNDVGQVAGSRDAVLGNTGYRCCRAFVWSKATDAIDLGSLGGGYSTAFTINNKGLVTGWSFAQDQQPHAYLWTLDRGMQDLGFTIHAVPDFGRKINNQGAITGTYVAKDGYTRRAFFWSSSGGMQDIGVLPGASDSEASALNDTGEVVGSSNGCAFRWTQAAGMDAFLGCSQESVAFDINNAGQIAGMFLSSDDTLHAFLWSKNQGMQDLGSGGRWAPVAINDKAHVVGNRAFTSPFLWTPDGGMQDLNSLVSTRLNLTDVWSINNAGQVAAAGQNPNYTLYLLTPKMSVGLASSQNPSHAGEAVTFTATASSIEGPPPDGENVTFWDSKVVLAVVPLAQGTASFATSALSSGKHAIRVTYAGDGIYASRKSAILMQVVRP